MSTITKINNITELRTRVGTANISIELLGYTTPNDGGNAIYTWDASSTETDDASNIIQVTGVATGRWKKLLAYTNTDLDYPEIELNKIIYTKIPYTSSSTVNLVTNSNLNSALPTGWTAVNDTPTGGGSFAVIENISGKNWLKLDCSNTSTTPSNRMYMEQVVTIPSNLRNAVLEFSIDVFGYFQAFSVNTEDFLSTNIVISSLKPERFTMYYRPNGAATMSIKLYRCTGGQEISGQFVWYGNIQLAEASGENSIIKSNLPADGLNVQLIRWKGAWNPNFQEKYLRKIKDTAPFIRVWLSSELYATYTLGTPVKRTAPGSLVSGYTDPALQSKIITGFSTEIYQMDWFFAKCNQLGIQVQVVLGSGFDIYTSSSTTGIFELIDTDTTVSAALTAYYVSIVNRYKGYNNIVGWEFINEGYATWRASYAGYTTAASNATVRSLSYAGYKAWERLTYTAVKAADPYRPVILDIPITSPSAIYYASDDVCDWFCPSLYGGTISMSSGNTSVNRFFPSKNPPFQTGDLKVGMLVRIYTDAGNTLPTGLSQGLDYYINEVGFAGAPYFKISLTSGGADVTFNSATGTGTFYFYSPNGDIITYEAPILEKMNDFSKFMYLSEFGANIIGTTTLNYLYRNEQINAAYIRKMKDIQAKYGIISIIAFDEQNLFFDSSLNLLETAKVLMYYNPIYTKKVSDILTLANASRVLKPLEVKGNITLLGLGNKLVFQTGTNACIGTATLAAGVATVATTAAVTGSKIFIKINTPGGTNGLLSVKDSDITTGVSFVIRSLVAGTAGTANIADTSTVDWIIFN